MKGHLRKRGEAWELRAYAGIDPLTNRQKYVTRTFRGGKREVEEALARFVTEVSGGGHAAQDTTVGDLIRQWLDLAKPELSPTTARGYDWIIKTYITPTFGKVALSRLRRALQQGVHSGWITTNPASLASPPRLRSRQLEPPDPGKVVQLIETAEKDDPDFACFLLLAATTGARRGELCGLRWSGVDLTATVLTISSSVVKSEHSALVEKDAKTRASRRIPLDMGTVKWLKAHRDQCTARATACDISVPESAHVFSPDADGGRSWAPNDVTKDFIRLRKQVGLDTVRLHDLRHFAATRLLAAGVPVRTVSGRLGHANATTTLGVYAHFVEESDRDAAAKASASIDHRFRVSDTGGNACHRLLKCENGQMRLLEPGSIRPLMVGNACSAEVSPRRSSQCQVGAAAASELTSLPVRSDAREGLHSHGC